MNEINESSNCTFIIKKNKKAILNCELNIEQYKSIKLYTFNTTKIEYKNEFNISLVNLSEVFLINEAYLKKEKNNFVVIIAITISGVIIIIIISLILVTFYIKKKKKLTYEKVGKSKAIKTCP